MYENLRSDTQEIPEVIHVLAPIHLFPLLEIYCSPATVSCPHLSRPTGSRKPLEDLQEWGLVERVPHEVEKWCHGWRITARGTAYVDALLRTPLPTQVWQVLSKINSQE